MVLVGVRSCIYSGTKVENGVVNYLSCLLEYFQFAVKNKLANVNQRKTPQRQILVNGLVCEFISLPVFISIHVTEFVCVLIDLFEEIVGSLIVRSDVGAIDIVLTFHLTYDNLRITSNV